MYKAVGLARVARRIIDRDTRACDAVTVAWRQHALGPASYTPIIVQSRPNLAQSIQSVPGCQLRQQSTVDDSNKTVILVYIITTACKTITWPMATIVLDRVIILIV